MSTLPAFDAALDLITRELAGRADIAAVLFFGSAARGTATARSDLDLYAITVENSCGHLGRRVAGVPVEVSFGSIAQMRDRLDREVPTVVHAFATGQIVFDRSGGALAQLCADAAALWARGPAPLDEAGALRLRFQLTDIVRDLEDMPEDGPATALLGAACLQLAVAAVCARQRIWAPGARSALAVLGACDPAFAALVRACAVAGFPARAAVTAADMALSALGGRLESYDTFDTSAP